MKINPGIITEYPIAYSMDILCLYHVNILEKYDIVKLMDKIASHILLSKYQDFIFSYVKSMSNNCFGFDYEECKMIIGEGLYNFLETELLSRDNFAYFFMIDGDKETIIEIWDNDDLLKRQEYINTNKDNIAISVFNLIQDNESEDLLDFNIKPDFSNRLKVEIKK